MIKNDLLPLIKDKIKHGDHIEITLHSIKDLFSKLSTEPLIKKNSNNNKYKDEDYLEIIELLMKHRRDQFEITDLIMIAVKVYSPDIIRLLVNEPYSVIIYPTTFEFAITDSNLETIKELVNLEPINFKNYGIKLISEEFKRKSLSLAAHRKTLKTSITEYIFNNPSLYSIPPPLSSLNNQQKQRLSNKRLKLFLLIYNNNNNNNNDNDDEEIEYEYIDFEDFMKLKSSDLLGSLMELDIVVLRITYQSFDSFIKMYHPYERLQVGIKIILKYDIRIPEKKREEILEKANKIDRNNETGFNKLKELRKLVAIELSNQINFYLYYWKAYRENIKKLCKIHRKRGLPDNNIEDQEAIYLNHPQAGDEDIEQVELLSYNLNSDSEEEDEIDKNVVEQNYSFEEYFNYSKRLKKESVFDKSNRYSDLLNSYLKAIKEGNIEKLEDVDTNNPMFQLDVSKYHKFQLPNEKEDVLKIWEYFNRHSFKQMIQNYGILIEFISSVINVIPPLELKISNIDDLLFSPEKLGTFLFHQLHNKNFNVIELLLNSFDDINFKYQPIELASLIDQERFLFDNEGELLQVDKKFALQIIRVIELVMDKVNKLTKDQKNTENILTTSYRLILNNLYDQLLRVKGLTIDQLEYVRSIIPEQLLSNNYEIYRIFFYLNIRSSKLTKYIIERPRILRYSAVLINNYYDTIAPITNEISCFDLRKFFKFDLFTYDYILGRESIQYSSGSSGSGSDSGSGSSSSGSSGDDGSKNNNKKYITQVDTLLRELIKQLSHDICTNVSNRDRIVKGKDFFNLSLNADLKFSLNIGRKDLFWESLDWIEQYMIKNENLMRRQFYQFNSPYESLLPTGTIFSNVNIIKKELPSKELTTIESSFLKIDNFEKPIPNESTIKVNWNSDKLIEPFKPIPKLINSFKFSDEVKDSVCKVMNVNEIQRFIQYNFFESFFQNEIYLYSSCMNREDLMSFLLNNYNIEAYFLLGPSGGYLECKLIFENHFEKLKNISNLNQWFESRYSQFSSALLNSFLKYICKENNITRYNQFIQHDNLQIRKQIIKEIIGILFDRFLSCDGYNDDEYDDEDDEDDNGEDTNQSLASIIKNQNNKVLLIQSIIEQSDTQLYFKSALDQFLLESKEDRKNDEINSPFIENNKNPFLQFFIKGNIKTCDIILEYYPNQFKITKDSITEALKLENIHIIKYYYKVDNCKNLINNFKNDNNLLKHLKNELSKHPIYKYHLTWL
ncbi:hypothetical protein DDB_G0277585 [Dictyostelium discoideum AX4]|uniref:Uncharacterized protein n=1 Tax=Dictyostelium discoideum TaxID=44689 RepID=Q8T250_DICDI|nr:hypothetical protein DDB_G0277585 [Dictyostelium discoideum AX4]EAL68610.1 hypothetical protein DDB_G0277585 [Dictyostelium discoideum AX4]|eukprot:XP_642550.1 hypothetical protein DDB_G0277585 [Dictyostelium discoideum AX4]